MAVYELGSDRLNAISSTSFADAGIKERNDLQRLLVADFSAIDPDVLVLKEEFNGWDGSNRRIDILGLDSSGNLVVVELKRSVDGGHMELQAIRYAAMVSTLTFDKAVEILASHFEKNGVAGDPEQTILDHLEWDHPQEDDFAQDVRIILVSGDFSKELLASVLWLNERQLNIECVRLRSYSYDERLLIDIHRVVPLPEAEDFQFKVREKSEKQRIARRNGARTTYDVCIAGECFEGLPMRGVVYRVIRSLIEGGKSPKDILASVSKRQNRLLCWVDGELSSSDFTESMKRKAASEGKAFDAKQWYSEDKHLFSVDGRTYCIHRRWGSGAMQIVDDLAAAFPGDQISCTKSR